MSRLKESHHVQQQLAREPPSINVAKETSKIVSFILNVVRRAQANGIVVGLSGGIDSAVVGALCVKAMSRSNVLGLMMPSSHTPSTDTEDALDLAKSWGIRTDTVPISRAVSVITKTAEIKGTKIAIANVEARVRMTVLYYYANSLGYLVAGTGDKSESLLGYFTKMGDGGADFLPIAHLYKTQVRELGAHLGLPRSVVGKPSSPQLWPGHMASDEIPADYDRLDAVLHRLFDLKKGVSEAALGSGLPVSVAKKALKMHRRSGHKRSLPPSLV
jgi:NAD+ synthase